MRTLILQLQYNGTNYHGWQKQKNTQRTIEHKITQALSQIAPKLQTRQIHCAGRTDRGVHAVGQVISIPLDDIDSRAPFKWQEGLNHFLDNDIRVSDAAIVDQSFHARFDAKSREYIYILNTQPSLFLEPFAAQIKGDLDLASLKATSRLILGHHNFQSFQGGSCQAKSPYKTILKASWSEQGPFRIFSIQACGFLHHMVRYLVSCQVQVALGLESLQWFESLLTQKVNHHYCASSKGLYFLTAHYDKKHNFSFQKSHPFIDLEALE